MAPDTETGEGQEDVTPGTDETDDGEQDEPDQDAQDVVAEAEKAVEDAANGTDPNHPFKDPFDQDEKPEKGDGQAA